MKKQILSIVSLITISITTAQAQEIPRLIFPVDCTLGKNCFTATYMDLDTSKNHKDFTCGHKSYDAHKGTDFALRSRIEMEKGVNVLAALDGTVLRIRNGESDNNKTEEEYTKIREDNRDCGNGILINHPPKGLQTFYCHLKENSLLVKTGDAVNKGQPIAQIGQSGFSEFPHLHFTVIKNGKHIDPFINESPEQGCGTLKESLWEKEIFYEPFTLFDGGFTTKSPDFKPIKSGTYIHPNSLTSTENEALVYWIGLYHALKNDEITMTIYDPQNHVFQERKIIQPKNKKRPTYYYTGRKLRGQELKKGTYTATTKFIRKDSLGNVIARTTYQHSIKVQ